MWSNHPGLDYLIIGARSWSTQCNTDVQQFSEMYNNILVLYKKAKFRFCPCRTTTINPPNKVLIFISHTSQKSFFSSLILGMSSSRHHTLPRSCRGIPLQILLTSWKETQQENTVREQPSKVVDLNINRRFRPGQNYKMLHAKKAQNVHKTGNDPAAVDSSLSAALRFCLTYCTFFFQLTTLHF